MLKAALLALQEWLHWRRVMAEIQARRLVLTELERVEREIDEIEDDIEKHRRNGDHADADRLLLAISRRACFERGILDLAEGAGFHRSERLRFGGSGDRGAEGRDNHRSDPVATEAGSEAAG